MAILQRFHLHLLASRSSSRARAYHATATRAAGVVIGIRREDPGRIWERRCPLTPEAVNELVEKEGVEVLVQECDRRVWSTDDFLKAGAKIHPTLAPAHIVLGIKETPLHEVLTDPVASPEGTPCSRTHLMFSHTTKGQLYNMELLSKFLSLPEQSSNSARPPRLIDYELLTTEDGKRSVGFGWFAGVAGTLESLCALAHSHLELGIASPFLYTPRPHTHPSLSSIRSALRDVGARIASEGMPKSLGPVVFGVTGTGKVSEGVLDILEELPTQKVKVQDLPRLLNDPDTDLHKIYVVHALPGDYFVRRDGKPYNRDDYYANPQDFESEFHTKVAPYLTLLLNGAGWSPNFPRLMTNDQLAVALERAQQVGNARFSCIGDISCDVEGGLQFLPYASTLTAPFFTTRPPTLPGHLPSLTMMSVDILPTALPLEASQHFSNVLMPYLNVLIDEYRGKSQDRGKPEIEDRRKALHRATVAKDGVLMEPFTWLEKPLNTWKTGTSNTSQVPLDAAATGKPSASSGLPKKKVLLLGSGLVSKPTVDELCKRPDVRLVIASDALTEAERLASPHTNATAMLLDIADSKKVEKLVEESDVVISLLPVPFHPSVAEICIRQKKHLVTASYISPAMRTLHDKAVAADVILLNEIGLDPGIDHCSAVSLIERLRAQNKKIISFTSFCGGLPAPEYADGVPLGYKFSWSPRGVLSAALNGAKYKAFGEERQIDGEDILDHYFPDVPVSSVMKLDGIANRNSLPYADTYGLRPFEDVRTMFRGTLRYPGFCQLMHMFKSIGLLDGTTPVKLHHWSTLTRQSLSNRLGMVIADDPASLLSALSDIIPKAQLLPLLDALGWLDVIPQSLKEGLHGTIYTKSGSLPPLPAKPLPPIDLFAMLLAHKLRYGSDERDLVILSHEIITRPATSTATLNQPSGDEEVHVSSLVTSGTPDSTAMARCVGLPVAFATLGVLDGRFSARGVQSPIHKEMYEHVLTGLESVGLGMKESMRRASAGRTVEQALSNI